MSNWKPYVIIIDGSYFLHRTWHAVPPQRTRAGIPTNAIYGTINAIHRILDRYNPTYMAVVFDSPEPTFRHKLSPLYKAHRPEYDPDMTSQLPWLHKIIEALGIPLIVRPGYEGDDLVGTLAMIGVEAGEKVIISTGDKDMMQLVCDQLILEDSFKDHRTNREGVFQKFGVYPEQIADLLALVGDSADGIVGVQGVGPKTAAGLLGQYKDIDGIIENVGNVRGRLGGQLQEGMEGLKLDRVLSKIVTDLPLELDLEDLMVKPSNVPVLTEIYRELEFMNYHFAPSANIGF